MSQIRLQFLVEKGDVFPGLLGGGRHLVVTFGVFIRIIIIPQRVVGPPPLRIIARETPSR